MEIREALEAAAKQEQDTTPAPEPVVETVTPAPEVEPPQEDTRTPLERARDEKGRFAKPSGEVAEKAAATKATTGAAPTETAVQGKPAGADPSTAPAGPPAPEAHAVKAPQSWTPAAREAFAKAPPEVQKEVERREREITRTLNEVAPVRQYAQAVQQSLAPYEGIARANGMDGMTYAGTALQQRAILDAGNPDQAVAVAAQVVGMLQRRFGPQALDMINAALQGQPVQAQPQPAPQQDVGRLVEQALQQRMAQAQEQRAAQAWQEFQGTQPEFLDAVRGDMQEILELAGRQGRNMTYQQAYDRACKLNEEVSSVLAQRQAAEAARTAASVTSATRAAASSVRSQPAAPPVGAQPKGIRGALEAAKEKLGM